MKTGAPQVKLTAVQMPALVGFFNKRKIEGNIWDHSKMIIIEGWPFKPGWLVIVQVSAVPVPPHCVTCYILCRSVMNLMSDQDAVASSLICVPAQCHCVSECITRCFLFLPSCKFCFCTAWCQ